MRGTAGCGWTAASRHTSLTEIAHLTLVNFVCLVLGCADFELRSDLKVFIGTSWITFVDCSPPKLDPCTSIAIDSLLVYIKCKNNMSVSKAMQGHRQA